MKIKLFFLFFLTSAVSVFAHTNIAVKSAQAQSCWTIITYDKDGTVHSGRNCVDPQKAEEEKQESQTEDRQRKITESGEILISDPPFGTKTKLRQMGYEVVGAHRLGSLEMEIIIVNTPKDKNLADAIKELINLFPSAIIDTNDFMDLSSGPDPLLPEDTIIVPFDRKTVGWGPVNDRCGFGMKIGMIDGAVDVRHSTLRNQKIVYKNFIRKKSTEAAYDHGTAVASMLVGQPSDTHLGGLLPGARLYAANIFEKRHGLVKGNLSAVLRALDWFVQNQVQVINMSVVGGINKLMSRALKKIKEKGLIIVAAAGNNGAKAAPVWPAADPTVLAVTALDYKLGIYKQANRGEYIDFAAPGVAIPTFTPDGEIRQSGTSFATPFITAVVALHLQLGFKADVDLLRKSMQRFANDLGEKGKDATYGWGLVRIKPSNC